MPVVGLISDIHANLEALEAVLDDAATVGVDALVCLGDVVGYGPDSAQCLRIVASTSEVMIRGNNEEALLGGRVIASFSVKARQSAEFTREQLGEDNMGLLELMQPFVEIGDLLGGGVEIVARDAQDAQDARDLAGLGSRADLAHRIDERVLAALGAALGQKADAVGQNVAAVRHFELRRPPLRAPP